MTALTPRHHDTTVYEPTVTGLPRLREYFQSIWERRPFIWHLARTNLKGEHYDTVFGQLWIILDPLLLAAVYFGLRSIVRPMGTPEERTELIAHLVSSIFFFYFIKDIVFDGAKSILQNKGLILNTSFPKGLLPLVTYIMAYLKFGPMLIIYLIIHAVLGLPFGSSLLWIPVLLVIMSIFGLGAALLLAPLAVFFRDTTAFLPYALRIWLYATPILYLSTEVPPGPRPFLVWNPLFPMFASLEHILAGSAPPMGYFAASCAWAVVFLMIGTTVFLARERDFAVRL